MRHRPTAIAALLVALSLATALPVAATPTAVGDAIVAATTPLDTNLLQNRGFNMTPTTTSPVPRWTVVGRVHTETFGTRSWPYPAYGAKYHGGARYLACYGGTGGLVRQTIDIVGRSQRAYKLRARIATSLGGVTGHRVRVSLRATGSGQGAYAQKVRTLEITNHYKKATTAVTLPLGTDRIVATIELLPKAGASRCKVMADSATVFLFTDGMLGGH